MTLKSDDSEYSSNFPKLNSGSKKTLEPTLNKIKKDFGESVQFGNLRREIDVVSTGSLALDVATGIGGYPRGRITQIAGWESSGKTTHALNAVANIQERGGLVAYIETEYARDPLWAEKQGVNVEHLIWLQIDDLETAGETAVDLASSGQVDMIVLDSVAGAPIKAVVAGDLGDSNMGKRAKIMSDFMPKLNGPVSRNNVWMIFTNQLRDSLDPYKPKPVRPGGHALDFHSSMIVDLKAKKEKTTSPVSYVDIRASVEKNKLATPFKIAEYVMDFTGYIDPVVEAVNILTDGSYAEILGVERAGPWYTLPKHLFPSMEEAKFQGQKKIQEALAEIDVLENCINFIKSKISGR
jgi:recombination protein RecA